MRFLFLLATLLTTSFTYAQDNIVLRNGEEIPAKVLEVNQTDLKYRKSANPEGPVYTAPLRDILFIKYANGTKDAFNTAPSVPLSKPETLSTGESVAPITLDGLRYHRSLFGRYFTSPTGQRMGLAETRSLLQSQPDALPYYHRGRSLRVWSVATAIPAVALIGTGVGLMVFGDGWGEHGHDRMFNDPRNRTNDPENDLRRRPDGFGGMEGFGAILAGTGVLLGAAAVWFDHRASVQFRRATDRYNNRHSTTVRFVPARRSLGIRAVLTF